MTIENPTRLKDGELGAVLRAADVAAAPERLASNAARIKAQIATVTAFALWKLLVALGILALAVPLAWKLATRSGVRAPLPPAPRQIVTATIPLAPSVAADAGVEAVDVAPDAAPRPHHVVAQHELADAGLAAPIDAAPEPSQLPAQIALYEVAHDAAARGELAHAIDLIDQLLRDFPATQLRAEAELTRAELLARTDRADAVTALEALIADPVHAGRVAELLRTLGDLYRRRGDCTRALDAYQRSLSAHPGERDRKAAEAGRDHCQRK